MINQTKNKNYNQKDTLPHFKLVIQINNKTLYNFCAFKNCLQLTY